MAEFNYDSFKALSNNQFSSSTKTNTRKVGYFSLKNDRDEAIVRFDVSSTADLTIATVHTVQKNGRFYKISCTRTSGKAPMTDCPLCAQGEKLANRLYIRLLEYKVDENGQLVTEAKVWERPQYFADELVEKLNNYGDLRNYLFKIKRLGAAGSTNTRYSVDIANPTVYKQEMYPADFSAFDNFDMSKHSYYVRTAAEIETFLQTGSFPVQQQVTATASYNQQSAKPTFDYADSPFEESTVEPYTYTRTVRQQQNQTDNTTTQQTKRYTY